MTDVGIVSVMVLCVIFIYYLLFERKPKNYPPGPIGIPILGNLLSLGATPHLAYHRFAKIYGPIFSVKLGPLHAVILHGSKLIKEAFADPRLSGRPDMEAFGKFLGGGATGIALSEGQTTTEKRRFVMRQLKDLSFGKNGMEGLIMDEVNELMDWIRNEQGKPISLNRRFNLAVVNSLWTILCGQRFEHDDPKLVGLLEELERTAKGILGGKLSSFLILFSPRIAKWFPNWSGWNFLVKSIEPRYAMFKKEVDDNKLHLSYGHPRDYIDAYLQESKKVTDQNSMFHEINADIGVQSDMADFFLAGTDTSATTLSWAILRLIHHTDIQTKIRSEIDHVVGHSRPARLTDRNNLPYTEAFIMELMRYTSIVSWGVPHRALTDVELHGFLIPKGTTVYSSLYSSHHDETVWGDPENFRPERFLSSDGTKVQRHEALIPFSTGKRVCVGETLGKDQVFLFLTNLVQRFIIEAEEGKPKPTLDIELGQATLAPHQYTVVMKSR